MGTDVVVGELMAAAYVAWIWAEADENLWGRSERRREAKPTWKRLGEAAEAAFLAKASSMGFCVAKPWGDSDRYDFVVEAGGGFLRVQVKSAHRVGKDGGYSFRAHGHSLSVYRASEIDALVAYVVPENAWYVFPVWLFRRRRSMKLFPGSRKKRSKFEKYREAWGILRGEAVGRGVS
jgi:PD-(D/E)XK nuclease superfamily protein